ncbi:hypothetical protein BC659_2585 [Sediminibacterium goheungense]|uniref:Uncharacterized protein n=1 Tax=Sediminibacterium goheungense TaxID=1086393 RepID=A0A4R6IT44_9BACT|nr:hypothetical protein BC659_2585 [Sediminibacterium goheungense]
MGSCIIDPDVNLWVSGYMKAVLLDTLFQICIYHKKNGYC